MLPVLAYLHWELVVSSKLPCASSRYKAYCRISLADHHLRQASSAASYFLAHGIEGLPERFVLQFQRKTAFCVTQYLQCVLMVAKHCTRCNGFEHVSHSTSDQKLSPCHCHTVHSRYVIRLSSVRR